jgi:hypothetical protein
MTTITVGIPVEEKRLRAITEFTSHFPQEWDLVFRFDPFLRTSTILCLEGPEPVPEMEIGGSCWW